MTGDYHPTKGGAALPVGPSLLPRADPSRLGGAAFGFRHGWRGDVALESTARTAAKTSEPLGVQVWSADIKVLWRHHAGLIRSTSPDAPCISTFPYIVCRNRPVERAEDDPGPGPHVDPDPHSA
jgi:hypothetical protein